MVIEETSLDGRGGEVSRSRRYQVLDQLESYLKIENMEITEVLRGTDIEGNPVSWDSLTCISNLHWSDPKSCTKKLSYNPELPGFTGPNANGLKMTAKKSSTDASGQFPDTIMMEDKAPLRTNIRYDQTIKADECPVGNYHIHFSQKLVTITP
ncbi:MAG: hypothetical protein GY807_22075 [Gammaproteobacteria bacterium]|nr:hypothetical protein [Gammaproteobacteria bacterium]